MKLTLNLQKIGAWITKLAGVASAIMGTVNPQSLPASTRNIYLIVAAVLLGIERYVTDPSTGNPPPPPAP